jgi:hypothetical protein
MQLIVLGRESEVGNGPDVVARERQSQPMKEGTRKQARGPITGRDRSPD